MTLPVESEGISERTPEETPEGATLPVEPEETPEGTTAPKPIIQIH
jgi:hypothetical protein